LFAGLREQAGAAMHVVELPAGATAGDVWAALALGDEPSGLLFAVNKRYAERAEALAARYGLTAVAIHHRVGVVAVGEPSVMIAVSAPHRQDALAACKDAIDELKVSVPLWKKEIYVGGEEWIGQGS
jgi:hypothetical protein